MLNLWRAGQTRKQGPGQDPEQAPEQAPGQSATPPQPAHMTGPQMEAEIRSDRLVLRFDDRGLGAWQVRVKDLRDGSLSEGDAFSADATGAAAEISAPMTAFNAATHTVLIAGAEATADLSPAMEKYRLDLTRVNDHPYMTTAVFGAGHRQLPSADLTYLLLCHLSVIPPTNQFYGGLISVLSFRIAEAHEIRRPLVAHLQEAWAALLAVPQTRADHGVRWRLSSCINLAILLCYMDREAEAAEMVEAVLGQPRYNGTFPLTYMNYACILALGGMLALDRDETELAYTRFAECASFCTGSVADLFSVRNNYFFQHELDVRTLIGIGYQAATGLAALSGPKHPGDSRLALGISSAPMDRSDFAPVFGRFRSILGGLPALSARTKAALNARAAARKG